MFVSIIVPLYNAAAFLDKCLISIQNQSYPYIEVILVDDGSSDNTVEKAYEIVGDDPRFIIVRQENAGPGAARNCGLDICKGQYISFVDSDDYLKADAIQKLLDSFEPGIDVVQCKAEKVYDNGAKDDELWCDHSCILTQYEAMSDYLYNPKPIVRFAVWAKMYRKSVLQGVRFPNMSNSEDVVFTARVIDKSRSIKYLDEVLYYAVVREGSLTHTKVSKEKIIATMNCNRLMIDLIDGKNEYYNLRGRVYWTMVLMGINCLNQVRRWDDEKKDDVGNEVIRICKSVRYPFSQFSYKERIITRLFMARPREIATIVSLIL